MRSDGLQPPGSNAREAILNDPSRLSTLADAGLLSDLPDASLDRLTRLAARLLHAPVALFNVITADRQYTRSHVTPQDWGGGPDCDLDQSFCVNTVISGTPLIIDDGRDHPLVKGSDAVNSGDILAYAGVPLITRLGHRLGTLCVCDSKPRPWSADEIECLQDLAATAATEIDLRLQTLESNRAQTESLIAREEAERANRAQSTFLSSMSHELRTPLNAILGFGQLLQMAELPELEKESAEQIVQAGHHLLHLVNDVLDLSKIESGAMVLSAQPVRITSLVSEVVALLASNANEKRVVITNNVPSSVWAEADRQRLKQVLVNVVSNGIKYSHESGTLSIDVTQLHTSVEIVIQHSGRDIAEAHWTRIFDPLDRLNAAPTAVDGADLGLAISRGLLNAMGGSIDVSSEVEAGAVLVIRLRSCEPDPDGERTASGLRVDAGGPLRKAVLYVEDDRANIRLAERIMSKRPAVGLITAMDGAEGLDLASELHPTLILLDMHLPDMSGMEVLQFLRANVETRAIPVIVVSADAMPGRDEQFRAGGVLQVMTKPYDVHAFLAMLDRSLSRPEAGESIMEVSAMP